MSGPTIAECREYASARVEYHRILYGRLYEIHQTPPRDVPKEDRWAAYHRMAGWCDAHGYRDFVEADQAVFECFLSGPVPRTKRSEQ